MWFLNLSPAFNLLYSKFDLQDDKPAFDLTVFTYNSNKKPQVFGFYFDRGVCVGRQAYLSFYSHLIWGSHWDFMSK